MYRLRRVPDEIMWVIVSKRGVQRPNILRRIAQSIIKMSRHVIYLLVPMVFKICVSVFHDPHPYFIIYYFRWHLICKLIKEILYRLSVLNVLYTYSSRC